MDHPIPVTFIRLIVLLPLIGATINFLAGAWLQKTFGKQAISLVGCGVVILAFLLAVRAFHGMIGLPPENRFMLDDLWKWFDVGGLNLDIAFWLDPLSMIMTLIITGVGGLIHIYSTGYMHDDDGYWRFFGWLNLFTFAMLVLVLGDNMWLMFVGWEGVGLCSFALIGFWYKVQANTTAGNKAFIVNRVGDLAFVIALYSLFAGLNALGHPTLVTREVAKYAPLLAGVPIGFAGFLSGHQLVGFVTLLMFIGATGKSAQIPLYVWLPDAMAGPTPVSALIHAATMVTAGVYMTSRSWPILVHAPDAMNVIAIVGIATAVFAATIGLVQNDIKKVFAYSTVSQLGYMFVGVGCGAFSAGIWHLMTHAFFKALLFLGAGSVIHACHGEQDMRHMGGLAKKIPITCAVLFCAGVAIAGVPPFSGHYSKDAILESAFQYAPWIFWVGVLTAGMTAFYVFRALFLCFFGEYRGHHHPHESPFVMWGPLAILAALSLGGGFIPILKYLEPLFPVSEGVLPSYVGWVSIAAGLGGIALAHL